MLAEPDAVARALPLVDDRVRAEVRRLQRRWRGAARGLEQPGEAFVPGGDRGRAPVERDRGRSRPPPARAAASRPRTRSDAAAASRRRAARAPAWRAASCPARRGTRAARRPGATQSSSRPRPRSGGPSRRPDRPVDALAQERRADAEGVGEVVGDDGPRRPRGHSSTPTSTLTAQPSATSSMRTIPTFQPTGTSRLNSTATVTVKAACPTCERGRSGRVGRRRRSRREAPPTERCRVGADHDQQHAADRRIRPRCRRAR